MMYILPCLLIERQEPTHVGLHYNGWLQALPENIGQGRKWVATANTLAYYDTELITAT